MRGRTSTAFSNSPAGKALAGYAAASEAFQENFASGALPGTHYNYWLVACPDSTTSATDPGCSNYSKPDSGYYLPGLVQNVTASDGTSPIHVLVSWDVIDGAGSYIEGELIALTVTPDSGWRVENWSGTHADSSTALTNTCTIVGKNTSVGVNFKTDETLIFSNGFESK